MHIALWIAQIVGGLFFLYTGVLHFIVPAGLPETFAWMYDLPTWLHWVTGLAEIAGGLGLILPAVTRIRTELVPLAAAGLVVLMLGAAIYHIARGEMQNVGANLFWAALMYFVWWGRTKKAPIPERAAA